MERTAETLLNCMKQNKADGAVCTSASKPAADGSAAVQPDFEAMAVRWLASMQGTKLTKQSYRRIARSFFRWLHARGIAAPDRETVLAWLEWLKQGHAASTMSHYMSAVHSFFAWTNKAGLYPDIAGDIAFPGFAMANRKDILSPKQIQTLLESIDRSTAAGLRDYAILAVMLTTGLDCLSLACAMEKGLEPDAEGATLRCVDKHGNPVAARLAPPVFQAVQAWLDAKRHAVGDSGEDMPLFTSLPNRALGARLYTSVLRCIVKARLEKAGISSDRLTVHALRHAAAAFYQQAGGGQPMDHAAPDAAAGHEAVQADAHATAGANAEMQAAPTASAARFLPPKREKTRMINVTMRLTPGAKASAARLAHSRGLSLSEFCAAVIDNVVRDAQGDSFEAA